MNVLPQIVPETFKNEWVDGLSNEAYHAMADSVSSSGVREALKSPLAFYRKHVIRAQQEPPSSAMWMGSCFHLAILQPELFRSVFVLAPDFGDMRSATNRFKREQWSKSLPITAIALARDEYDRMMRMIEAVQRYNAGIVERLLKGCVFEKSGFFRDHATGLKCRFRPDALKEDLSILIDIKTTRDPSRSAFARSVWQYQYHCQLAFYSMGVNAIHGRVPEKCIFIAVQNCEPFDVSVWEAPMAMIDRGEQAMRRGLDSISNSIRSDTWPGCQPEGIEVLDLPVYTDNLIEGQ